MIIKLDRLTNLHEITVGFEITHNPFNDIPQLLSIADAALSILSETYDLSDSDIERLGSLLDS